MELTTRAQRALAAAQTAALERGNPHIEAVHLALAVLDDPEQFAAEVQDRKGDVLVAQNKLAEARTAYQAALDKIEKAYRVYAKKVPTGKDGDYSMDHSAIVYLMDKNGRFVAPFRLDRKPQESAAELRKYF